MRKFKKRKLFYLIPIILLIIIFIIIGKELVTIIPHLKNYNNEDIKKYLTSFGLKGAIFIVLIQSIQIMVGFIPSEFVQLASGLTYGTIYGGLLCTVGVILGASTIYILVNMFKVNSKELFKNDTKLQQLYRLNKKNKVTKTILALFFLPAIPYGIICYYGASQKISFRRYLTLCIIGTFPSIYLSAFLGKIMLNSIGGNFILILILVIAFFILSFVATTYITKYNKKKLGIKDEYIVNKPNGFIYHLLAFILFPYFKIKNRVSINKSQIKGLKPPYLILCEHPSKPDFIYSLMSVYPKKVNVVAARYYFYNKKLSKLLHYLQVIPKNLFNPDIETIKNIMSVIKNEGIVLLMPEGRLSASGELEKMPDGTEKLIKKLGVPVVSIHIRGAHLTGAKWMQVRRKGKIEVTSKILFTSEEINTHDEVYLKEKIESSFSYNDYKWNREAKVEYKGKDLLKGVESILYLCPKCEQEFALQGSKNEIFCKHCNQTYTMNNYYEFLNPINNIKDINDWFKYQINYEKEKMIKNSLYNLKTEVILKMPSSLNDALEEVGKGVCILNKNELTYSGTIKNENVTKTFYIKDIAALPFGCNEDFEIYHDNTFYYFVPTSNKKQCVKWSIYAEVAHNIQKK